MQIINSFQHHSIYHLASNLNHLHYLQRTYSTNLSSLLPLLLLQFFSITLVVGQNAAVTATSARTTAQHPTNPIHSQTLSHSSSSNTATTLHPTSSNTFSLPRNTNTLNNNHHHPTTLSTDDLNQQRMASATTANHHRHHRLLGISPSSDTLLNTVPIFPSDYDNLKPPKEDGAATTVSFHVWVLSLDSIDEDSMTYVADIFMSQSWKDHRLNIPDTLVNTTSNYRLLPLSWLNYMWRPDSFFKNAKQVTFQEMTVPNHYLWMYEDKKILYMVKLTLLLSCSMKFQSYPHDTQQCKLQIESLSYTMDDLVFDWEKDTPLVVEKLELPQHNLIDAKIDTCHNVYSSGNFTCVQVVFRFKRRLGYFIFHTYIPTCLIVIMSWISFYIKPEAVPARVTLCVTSLLTLSTQHAQSQKSLPPVSYIKAIDIFMSSCTVFVFSSLMEYLIINIVYLNHNNYAAYGSSANYNGNYYTGLTGLSSSCLNTLYMNSDQHCNDKKCDCNLSRKKLNRRLKKNLKQRQGSNWFNRWFATSSTSSSNVNRDSNKDNVNNNADYPITNLNSHQTPLSNGISTNNINQNVPTSTSLTNLAGNPLKESLPNSVNGSVAVIAAQTTSCNHCTEDDRRRHSKDSLCRKHVQCIQLSSSTNNLTGNINNNNNVGLNSVITTSIGGTTTSTTTNTNASHKQKSSAKDPNQTTLKKIRPFKQCSKHNFKRTHDSQQQSNQFEYLNNEYRHMPHFSSGDLHSNLVLSKRNRAILVDKISRWTFPLSFILLNLVYWTVYLNDNT